MFPVDFPEDKSAYIPAIIELIAVLILAFLAVKFFMYLSNKELKKTKMIEVKMKERIDQEEKNHLEK